MSIAAFQAADPGSISGQRTVPTFCQHPPAPLHLSRDCAGDRMITRWQEALDLLRGWLAGGEGPGRGFLPGSGARLARDTTEVTGHRAASRAGRERPGPGTTGRRRSIARAPNASRVLQGSRLWPAAGSQLGRLAEILSAGERRIPLAGSGKLLFFLRATLLPDTSPPLSLLDTCPALQGRA